jgi:hypothetical protein
MKIHEGAKNSPLPNSLEDAIKEILELRTMLIRERENFVKLFVKADQDRRSAKGTINTLLNKKANND